MRASLRLLAAVQRGGQFLEPGAPTGLCGLATHPSPRSALIALYISTLEKLKQFPEHSVYRQSTEALTKHRMNIVESVKPAGLQEWQTRVQTKVDYHSDHFRKVPTLASPSEYHILRQQPPFVKRPIRVAGTRNPELDAKLEALREEHQAADNEAKKAEIVERARTLAKEARAEGQSESDKPSDSEHVSDLDRLREQYKTADATKKAEIEEQVRKLEENAETAAEKRREEAEAMGPAELEPEPLLTADQVGEIENKINAGLIEEIITMAEGEYELAEIMLKNQVWEDLEEKPVEGQWTYYERDRHTAGSETSQ